MRGDLHHLCPNFFGRTHERAATDRCAAASISAHAIRYYSRVAVDKVHIVDVNTQLVGHDLCHRRLVTLTMRMSTGQRGHFASGMHTQASAFPEAGDAT